MALTVPAAGAAARRVRPTPCDAEARTSDGWSTPPHPVERTRRMGRGESPLWITTGCPRTGDPVLRQECLYRRTLVIGHPSSVMGPRGDSTHQPRRAPGRACMKQGDLVPVF